MQCRSSGKMSGVKGELEVCTFLRLVCKGPVICQVHSLTKDEIVDSAALNCPSSFGRVVVVDHCLLNSPDSRLDKSSGCGR
jgi:hypothetical protein